MIQVCELSEQHLKQKFTFLKSTCFIRLKIFLNCAALFALLIRSDNKECVFDWRNDRRWSAICDFVYDLTQLHDS